MKTARFEKKKKNDELTSEKKKHLNSNQGDMKALGIWPKRHSY